MQAFTLTNLYVSDVARSLAFWRQVLQVEPVLELPTYAMLVTSAGNRLGLWQNSAVLPPVVQPGCQSELTLLLDSREAVDRCYQQWLGWDITLLQPPLPSDYGYTFVASDPDGHRLRVYVFEPSNG